MVRRRLAPEGQVLESWSPPVPHSASLRRNTALQLPFWQYKERRIAATGCELTAGSGQVSVESGRRAARDRYHAVLDRGAAQPTQPLSEGAAMSRAAPSWPQEAVTVTAVIWLPAIP